jgi:leucyl-tRNA synthetase
VTSSFARAFQLPIRVVVQPADRLLDGETMTEAFHDPGVLSESGPFTGRLTPEVIPEIIAWLSRKVAAAVRSSSDFAIG